MQAYTSILPNHVRTTCQTLLYETGLKTAVESVACVITCKTNAGRDESMQASVERVAR